VFTQCVISAIPNSIALEPNIKHHIKTSEVFNQCTREEIENLVAPFARLHSVPARELLFREGEQAMSVWIVVSGKIKLGRTNHLGKELVSEIAGATASIGWEDVLAGQRFSQHAIAMETTSVLEIDAEDVFFLVERNPRFSRALAERISRRLLQTLQQQMNLLYMPVRQRVARALLSLHHAYNDKGNALMPTKRRELASMAAVTRETATRIVKEFERDRLLIIKEEGILLTDPEKMEAIGKQNSDRS